MSAECGSDGDNAGPVLVVLLLVNLGVALCCGPLCYLMGW